MTERVLRARLEAETGAFSARMAAAEAQLVRMERAPVAAARGMRMMESGMQGLAFQALGTTGPVGSLAASLGLLAVGGPTMLAAVAGLGAFAFAIRELDRPLRELQKQVDETGKRVQVMMAELSGPSVAIASRLSGTAEELDKAKETLAAAQAGRGRFGMMDFAKRQEAIAKAQLVVNNLDRERLGLLELLDRAHEKMADSQTKAADTQIKANEAVEGSFQNVLFLFAKLQAQADEYRREWEGWRFVDIATGFGGFQRTAPQNRAMERSTIGLGRSPEFFIQQAFADTGPTKVLQEAIEAERTRLNLIDHLKTVIAEEGAATERAIVAQQLLALATEETGRTSEEAAARMIGAIGAMAAAMIQGPSVGGFLRFAGGIASLIPGGQLVGAGLMAAGGIASAIESRNRQQSVRVDSYGPQALSQMRREERQDRLIGIIYVNAEGQSVGEIRYETLRAERRDAVPRLPKGG